MRPKLYSYSIILIVICILIAYSAFQIFNYANQSTFNLRQTTQADAATNINLAPVVGETSTLITDLPVTTSTTNGVTTFKAQTCTDSKSDRFEITLSRKIPEIYGLGINWPNNRVSLADGEIIDTHFSIGDYGDFAVMPFNGDAGRMRTPILIFPKEKMIIAYLQPAPKIFRLTRTSTNTTIVFKKNNTYNDGQCSPLVIVKGTSLADAYSKFNSKLKSDQFYFKKPHWNAFGLGWETFSEYGCAKTSLANIQFAYSQYKNAGIPLSNLTIGSGYWNSGNTSGCGGTPGDLTQPTMEVLAFNSKFPASATNSFFSTLISEGVYPQIGMRHGIKPGAAASVVSKVGLGQSIFFPSNCLSVPLIGVDPDNNVCYLNINNTALMSKYIDLLSAAYGNFRGIKEDGMIVGDQIAYGKSINPAETVVRQNFPDGFSGGSYKHYVNKFNGDFMIVGSNDWFGVGSDLQAPPGYIPGAPRDAYHAKNFMMKSLIQSISGYPHPLMELDFTVQDQNDVNSPLTDELEFLRSQQTVTFMPGAMHARGFWHMKDATMKSQFVYFAQLRERLRRYVYDNAMTWYETGVPTLQRALFLDTSQDKDANLADNNNYSMYGPYTASSPRYEYMFGNALLIRPVFTAAQTQSVYLPQGTWYDIFSGEKYAGKSTIQYTIDVPSAKLYPVFAKGGEPFILQNSLTDTYASRLRLYPADNYKTLYTHYTKQGNKAGTVEVNISGVWNWNTVKVTDKTTNTTVAYERSSKNELMFNLIDGRSYIISSTPPITPAPVTPQPKTPAPNTPAPITPEPATPIANACSIPTFFTITSPAGSSYSKGCLAVPNKMYNNENRFDFFNIPSTLTNIPFVLANNNPDKDDESLSWSISLSRRSQIYLMYRKIPGQTIPQWMINSGYKKITSENYLNLPSFVLRKNEEGLIGVYDIYEGPVSTGHVNFGPASDSNVKAFSMYIIGVKPL